uniref:C2H2-type domain-containing protein n=1 Tax=Neogobius melanostomus TaxID=47308 RepID=A0A8C6UN22_9GOBI
MCSNWSCNHGFELTGLFLFHLDATGPHIKEEHNDICITDIQHPVTSTNLQDVQGESQNLKSKEVQNAARKEQEGTNTSHQVTEVSSHPPLTTKKTIPGKKRKTPAKRDYNKCSHGYRLPKGYASKQIHASKNNDINNVDDTNMLTFTNLDNVEIVSHIITEQATMHKDASENTASTSLTGSSTTKIDTDAAPNVINDKQPTCTKRSEIASSSVNPETTQKYSYEWKRPTQTKGTCQKSPFECDICGKVSSNFKNYKSHVKSHTAEKKFKCTTCDKMFRESCDLTKHEKIHTGEKPFKCSDCGKAFNRRFNLDLHKRVHTGEKPYACGCCKKTFTSRVNLRKHERIHTGEKPYTCEQCKKEFADSSSYRNHQRVHTGEKPYKCCFCKKEFATRTTLKRHIRVHTGEKPYKCSRCEKSFATNTDMKVHMRIHTGEKPYKCEICGQEFSNWTNYKRHTNIHKPKAKVGAHASQHEGPMQVLLVSAKVFSEYSGFSYH